MNVFDLFAKISIDTSDYKKGVSESINYSKNLKSELKNVDKQVEALSAQYKASVNSTGRYSEETKKLADQLKEAKDKQKDLREELKSSTSISEKFGSGFGKIGSVLGTAAKGAGVFTAAVGAVGMALNSVEESTREYREAMGKLETAFETAGYSANVAQQAYSGLYEILGDTDTATEAAQLMAKLTDSAEDVATWVDIAAGAYGTFGDALPINSLIEATNETVKVGEVTGVLADALNWAGISEDDFNAKLADCSGEAERNQLVMDTLSATYDDASDAFYENNEQLVQNRENQQKLDDAMADVGDSVSRLKNAFLNEYTPAIETAAGATADFLDTLSNPSTWAGIGQNLTYVQALFQQLITGESVSSAKATAERVANQYYVTSGEAARQAAKEAQAADDSVVSNAQKNAFVLQQRSKETENSAKSISNSYSAVSTSASNAAKSASSSAKSFASAASVVKKSAEEEKSYFEKLQESYRETSTTLNTELENIETSYKIWNEQVGDSVSGSDQLSKKLESLNQQHETQQKIVDAAQKAYDDFAASQEYTKEGSEQLRNTLLREQLALSELQTEIDGTSDALNKATNETEQFKIAAQTAFDETGNFSSALTTLGNDASDLGDMLGITVVSDLGVFIANVGNGINTVLNFANSISTLVSTIGSLSNALNNLMATKGGSGIAGALLGGSAALGLGTWGSGVSTGIGNINDLWSDSSKSGADKVLGTIGNVLWYGSGIGGFVDAITGASDKLADTIFGEKEDESLSENISDSITTGVVSGITSSTGTTIEKVEIYIEGSQYKDEDSLAEAISIKLQNLTERKVNVFA